MGIINEIYELLNKYPDLKFSIEGHTDSVGSETSNLRLSERRARAAKSYLVKLGVNAARLAIVGRGESRPLPGEPHDSKKQRRIQMRNLGQ